MDELRGRRYPVCLRKHAADNIISAVFPQFSFGVGSGVTQEDAVKDAEYILAAGLEYLIEGGEAIPGPLEQEAAQEMMREWSLNMDGVIESWAVIEVKPECLVDGE